MNFDINMLSSLMQMLGSQKPQSEPKRNYNEDNRANNEINRNASVFATQNGLGQKVNFEEAEPKTQQAPPKQNPMSSILEMMTGNSSSPNGDFMSSLMPMLLNMMSQKNTSAQTAQSKTQPAQNANTEEKNNSQNGVPNTAPKSSTKTQPRSQDKYEPIAFAGYALISTLNKLYISKRLAR